MIYHKCSLCGCWRKFGAPIMLNEQGEATLLQHIRDTGKIDDAAHDIKRILVKIGGV